MCQPTKNTEKSTAKPVLEGKNAVDEKDTDMPVEQMEDVYTFDFDISEVIY